MGNLLHFVDGLDEVEEGVGTLGLVSNLTSSAVSWIKDGVIFEVVKDVTVDAEFFGAIHIDLVQERYKVT